MKEKKIFSYKQALKKWDEIVDCSAFQLKKDLSKIKKKNNLKHAVNV
jgi:hypothetical protein